MFVKGLALCRSIGHFPEDSGCIFVEFSFCWRIQRRRKIPIEISAKQLPEGIVICVMGLQVLYCIQQDH
jgi:hypothetical protein